MDTKWKNRKNAVSFMIFGLGASLTLGSISGILRDKPDGAHIWQADQILEEDYQQSRRFRGYISGRLENFLVMACGGDLRRSWGYDGASGFLEEGSLYAQEAVQELWDGYNAALEELKELEERRANDSVDSVEYEQMQAALEEELEVYSQELDHYREELGIDQGSPEQESGRVEEHLSRETGQINEEEEKARSRRREQIAQSYHEQIRGDQNLLYTVSYDGKELYANTDQLAPGADGKPAAPQGCNFLLFFDGERVTITKDGKELDVYGDGYYRDGSDWQKESDWCVPGYRNFPVEESIKKAQVCMAVVREPMLYRESNYVDGGFGQYDNTLYWMYYNRQRNRMLLEREFACLLGGIVLLALAFLCRKGKREAAGRIAGFQAGIWAECKALLFAGGLVLVFFIVRESNMGYGLWQELREVYFYNEYRAMALTGLGGEILRNVHPAAWVLLFWCVWLLWNDFRYNRKLWKNSLTLSLYRAFSAKGLSRPLPLKMARRNALLSAAAALYGLLAAGTAIALSSRGSALTGFLTNRGRAGVTAVVILILSAGFLVTAYLIGKKNVETARDMEALAGYISRIREGNYGAEGEAFAGHDLEAVMAQLEDIRQGMEKAVDEQMKSERMKVELIANVSHDIKTPLTSIISYVQFLKQEEGLPEHIKDYVAILDEKSQRLKNMVQDVFAVSKAASGELPMHMEKLDFGKLLCQTLADMEEEIEKSPVSFRTDFPQSPVMIMADGQRMYRVFQNLFQNAIKYSLAGSRVYVTLTADGAMAVASVKNASLMELERDKDFAERFARGDKSRTDGGSGLGLSIAQSFTQACGGEFSWETDADLFVVRVCFRIAGDKSEIIAGTETSAENN